MEEEKVLESHSNSAAAFVEGGIQDACDDACSICLEDFCESDPSTLTSCGHEFHLHCILEWCQRSSQCPMCWQSIRLKDPGSQELLDDVEHERNIRTNPPRNSAIFHHPMLGDFELQHLPAGASESELEERILQHWAAAATMGRSRQLARREVQRIRSSSSQTQGNHPPFLIFSTHPNGASPASSATQGDNGSANRTPTVVMAGSNSPFVPVGENSENMSSVQADDQLMTAGSSAAGPNHQHEASSSNRRSPAQTSPSTRDGAGPSDLQSFSESLKCRLCALSMRYKESINNSTRNWKEKLFARNSSIFESDTQAHTEVDRNNATSPDFSNISITMDHLEIADDNRIDTLAASNTIEAIITTNSSERPITMTAGGHSLIEDGARPPCSVNSEPN